MTSALEKMMGRTAPKPQLEGEALSPPDPEAGLSAKDKMLVGILKGLVPGIDLTAIAKIGTDAQEFAGRVGATLTAHSEALSRIETNQAQILKQLSLYFPEEVPPDGR